MKAIYAAVLVCALGAMCPAQELRTNNQALARLLAEADKVLTTSVADNVAAAKEVDAVFAAANRLFKEGMLERSESYFVKGLQLSPWDMDQQVAYAKLLIARGKEEQAKQVAMIVLRSSERQALLEDAAKLAGVPLLQHVIPLPASDSERPCICFVPIGDVDDWIIQNSGKQLSEKLGLPVYVFPDRLALPAPHRSFHDKWIANIKKDIKWDHPFVQSQLKLMRINEKEKITADQTVELLGRLLTAQGQEDALKKLKENQETVKARDQQWDAAVLLDDLMTKVAKQPKTRIVYVGIVSVDIYGNDNNYLYGLAKTGSFCCLISYRRYTAWFTEEKEKQERLLERIHKQLLSSIGFALGVPRPTDPRSARSYPNSLTDHDAKGTWLSPQCIEGFEKALGQALPERTKKETREAL